MRRRTFLFGTAGAILAPAVPSWAAPAGLGTVAFVQQDGLWARDLPAGPPVRLATGAKIAAPRFSPSGQWISYFDDGVAAVVSHDGKQNSKFGKVARGGFYGGVEWRPGRDDLLVDMPPGIEVFSPANGWTSPSKAMPRIHPPLLFSPDGKQIVYSDDVVNGRGPGGEPMRTGRLRLADVDAARPEPKVLTLKYLSNPIPCVWSQNGESILYWEDPDFSASVAADGLSLFRVPAAGGSPVSLGVVTLLNADLFARSPTQNKLAVTAGGGREEWEQKRIAVIELDTWAVSYITDQNTVAVCPSWSPDGKQLAYSAAPAPAEPAGAAGIAARRLLAQRRIWIADVAGTRAPRQLTSDDRYRDEEPMWSAGGTHILFCRMDDRDRQTLWLIEAGGSRPLQIAELYADPGRLAAKGQRITGYYGGYYGHIEWRNLLDWFRPA